MLFLEDGSFAPPGPILLKSHNKDDNNKTHFSHTLILPSLRSSRIIPNDQKSL